MSAYFFQYLQIVAIILVNTGVALLAYMDGVSGTTTLVGVVLSAAAAGLSGVYKVTFKKLIGELIRNCVGRYTTALTAGAVEQHQHRQNPWMK